MMNDALEMIQYSTFCFTHFYFANTFISGSVFPHITNTWLWPDINHNLKWTWCQISPLNVSFVLFRCRSSRVISYKWLLKCQISTLKIYSTFPLPYIFLHCFFFCRAWWMWHWTAQLWWECNLYQYNQRTPLHLQTWICGEWNHLPRWVCCTNNLIKGAEAINIFWQLPKFRQFKIWVELQIPTLIYHLATPAFAAIMRIDLCIICYWGKIFWGPFSLLLVLIVS